MSRLVSWLLALVAFIAAVAVPLVAPSPAAAFCRHDLTMLRLADRHLYPGGATTGTLTFDCRLPRRQKVRLHTTAGLRAPAFVWVAKGRSHASFMVTNPRTRTSGPGRVTATYRGSTLRRTLNRLADPCDAAHAVRGISWDTELRAGGHTIARVALNCMPKNVGSVAVASSSPRIKVPATVPVSEGLGELSFPVAAAMPTSSEDAYDASVRFSLLGHTFAKQIHVEPALAGIAVVSVPASDTAELRVALTGAPAVATQIVLSSDGDLLRPSDRVLKLPAQVTVPAGAQRASFAVPINRLAQDTSVVVTGELGARTATAKAKIARFFQSEDAVEVNDLTVSMAGSGVNARAQAPLAIVLTDHLAGPDGIQATVDGAGISTAYVTIKPGTFYGTGMLVFPDLRSSSGAIVGLPSTLTLHISLVGSGLDIDRTFTVALHPALRAVTLPDPVYLGSPNLGTVSVIAPAAQDETVTLTGSGLSVPSTVTIPAGASSATFEVVGAKSGTGYVVASLHGTETFSPMVEVGAAPSEGCGPTGITVPEHVFSGGTLVRTLSQQATLMLGCATETEVLVPLRVEDESDRGLLSVPAFVRVPAGATSGSFTFSTYRSSGGCAAMQCTQVLHAVMTAGTGEQAITKTVTIEPGLDYLGWETDPDTGRRDLDIYMMGHPLPGTMATITTSDPAVLDYPSSVELQLPQDVPAPLGMPAPGWAFRIPAQVSVKQPVGTAVRVMVTVGPAVLTIVIPMD